MQHARRPRRRALLIPSKGTRLLRIFFMKAIIYRMLHARAAKIAASSTMACDVLQGAGSCGSSSLDLPGSREPRTVPIFARVRALNLTSARAFPVGVHAQSRDGK